MKVPHFDKQITFLVPNGIESVDGLDKMSYISGQTVWAAVRPVRGSEFWEAQAVQSENVVKIIMWYIPGIKQDWKVRFVNENYSNDDSYVEYEITNIIDVEMKHRVMELHCKVVG